MIEIILLMGGNCRVRILGEFIEEKAIEKGRIVNSCPQADRPVLYILGLPVLLADGK
jgi:hypothetical protein